MLELSITKTKNGERVGVRTVYVAAAAVDFVEALDPASGYSASRVRVRSGEALYVEESVETILDQLAELGLDV